MTMQNAPCGKNKKSQLKIQQMAIMLLAVVLFFAFVGLIFLTLRIKSLYEDKNFLERNRATMLAEFLADSPEFTCGNEYYCIDTDRIISFSVTPYNGFWPVAYIHIRKIKSETEDEIPCSIANYPNCNYYEFYDTGKTSTEAIGSFVSLCRWERISGNLIRKCELGKIIIGYEVKGR